MLDPKIIFLFAEANKFASPVFEIEPTKSGLEQLLAPLGYNPLLNLLDDSYSFTLPAWDDFDQLLLNQLPSSLDDDFPVDFAAFLTQLVDALENVYSSVRDMLEEVLTDAFPTINSADLESTRDAMFLDILHWLATVYLRREYSILFKLGLFIDLVVAEETSELSIGTQLIRNASTYRYQFHDEKAAEYANNVLFLLNDLFADVQSPKDFLNNFLSLIQKKSTSLINSLFENISIGIDFEGISLTTSDLLQIGEDITFEHDELIALNLDFFEKIELKKTTAVDQDSSITIKFYWQTASTTDDADNILSHQILPWILSLPARDQNNIEVSGIEIFKIGDQIKIRLNGFCQISNKDAEESDSVEEVLNSKITLTLAADLQMVSNIIPPRLPALTLSIEFSDVDFNSASVAQGFGNNNNGYLIAPSSIGNIRIDNKLVPQNGLDFQLTLSLEAFSLLLPQAIVHKGVLENDQLIDVSDDPARVTFATAQENSHLLQLILDSDFELSIGMLEDAAGNRSDPVITVDPLFIGNPENVKSGFLIAIEQMTFDMPADGTVLPNAIFVDMAVVHFPSELDFLESISIADATINDKGFTGAVSILFDDDATSAESDETSSKYLFGVLPIHLYMLNLEFVDSYPVAFELKAAVNLLYFDEDIDLTISIDDRFNIIFKLESTDPEGIVLTKEELLAITFRSAGFEYYNDISLLRLSLSGGIEPLLWNADGLDWPKLDVTNLVLEQDLSTLPARIEPPVIKFEEAWLDLKELATLDLFGFYFELNRIGIGYIETTDKLWLDLTGSLRLIELIPIGLGVEGFRITWPRRIYEDVYEALGIVNEDLTADQALEVLVGLAARIEVKFDGVYLFFGVPQAVEFEGYIRFIKEAQKIGFAGDVALRVPASGLAIEAGLLVGMNFEDPPYPFLYVHFGILLPTGIPLGQSGLALKGAQGLFGLNVYPDRTPEQNPYYDWYKRGPIEGAHPTNKWTDQIWSIAFGAGITITTTDGKILGVRGLLALVLPGPIIFIEGKALIFDGVFPIDGPLKALGYFDGNELTAQINIEADLELVEGIIDVNAGLEAFFDFKNLTNWHLYLGKDEPADRRVRANILQLPLIGWLFEANCYLMLDMQDEDTLQARLGMHIGFEPPAVDLVVASAEVRAVIEGTGLLTVNPFQFNGELTLDAVLDVNAFGLLVAGVEATAAFIVEGPLPFVVDTHVYARVDLPVPNFEEVPLVGDFAASALDWFEETVADLPEIPEYIAVEVPFHWEFDGPPRIEPLVKGVALESHFASGGVSALAGEDTDLWQAPVVPLDARPSILFDQNINQVDPLSFGGFSSQVVQHFYSGNLAFLPQLHDVEIYQLPMHKATATSASANDWGDPVGRASEREGAPPLWGAFRPEMEAGESTRASRRTLDLYTANVFEFLTGVLPLAMPTDDAGEVRQPISPADGYLAWLQWCAPSSPKRQCISGRDWEQAAHDRHQKPLLVAHDRVYNQALTIQDVQFIAADLRILLPPTGRRSGGGANNQVEQPLLRTATSPREAVKLTIHFPEPVVTVSLSRPKRSKTEIDPTPWRSQPDSFVATNSGHDDKKERITLRLGQPCKMGIPFELKEQDGITEIIADEWFDCLKIEADGEVDLVELCWVTLADYQAAVIRNAECDSNAGLGSRSGEVPFVLSAGSFYKVVIKTNILLDEAASDCTTLALFSSLTNFYDAIGDYLPDDDAEPDEDTFYFRTAGPPQDLSPYVKWVSPQHQSTDHFHEDDFVIRFNRSYIHRLYPDPDSSVEQGEFPYAIEAFLRDAEGHVIRGFFHNWTTAASPTLFPDERRFLEAVENSASSVAPPPPDDILEIRRMMPVRSGADLGAEEWKLLSINTQASPNPKWQRLANGSIRVVAAGNEGGSCFIAPGYDWPECRIECTLSNLGSTQGAVGIVFGLASVKEYYLLRIDSQQKTIIQLVRVRNGLEEILDQKSYSGNWIRRGGGIIPPKPSIPLRTAIWIRRTSAGLEILAKAGNLHLIAIDPFPPQGDAKIGFYARHFNGLMTNFSITKPRQELKPGARYTLLLTGGEGGRTILVDDFSEPVLGDHWQTADPSSWLSGEGLRVQSLPASLTLHQSIEDVELLTTLDMTSGDTLRLRLRTPDANRVRDNKTAYELLLQRNDQGLDISAVASSGPDGARHPLASGHAGLGTATRFPLRVRLIGDTLRVWVFEWLLIDITLKAYEVEVTTFGRVRPGGFANTAAGLRNHHTRFNDLSPRIGARSLRRTIPLAWSGQIQWMITAGQPTIRSIDLRQPALLSVDFTASPYGSLAALFDGAQVSPAAFVVAGYEFPQYADDMEDLAQSQRMIADARLNLLSTQALFSAKRADREAMETAKQQLVRVMAEHNAAFAAFLAHLGFTYETSPTAPTIIRLETDDGEWLGYLLRSPQPLDLERLGLPDSEPFTTVGRIRFKLSAQDDGSEVSTAWIAGSDGTTAIIYQRVGPNNLDNHADTADLAPVALINQVYQLQIEYIRHHGDDTTATDHLFDRPYILSRSSSGPEIIPGLML